jgi:hypothetical protein
VGWETARPGNPLPDLGPVQAARKLDFSQFPETEEINRRYREHPQVRTSVWKRYRLVRSQWPINGSGPPSPASDVANTTMETYRQRTTCMACHAQAQKASFVYFLEVRAFPQDSSRINRSLKAKFDAIERLDAAKLLLDGNNRPTSFNLHLKPLFRMEPDVNHMRDIGLDLSRYEDVKENANAILQRLKARDRRMMPPAEDGGPWPNEWTQLFERWISEGRPE